MADRPLPRCAAPLLLGMLLCLSLPAAAPRRLEIQADYLIFSYDHNYLYGRGGARLVAAGTRVAADEVHVDVTARRIAFGGGCRLESGGQSREADVAELDLAGNRWTLLRFGPTVTRETLAASPGGDAPAASPPFPYRALAELRESLLYYLVGRLVIRDDMRVVGRDVTMFVEGLQSLSFRSFVLAGGDATGERGLALDRLWFTAAQGIEADGHVGHERTLGRAAWTSRAAAKLRYDILRRNRPDRPLRITLDGHTRLALAGRTELELHGSHVSHNLSGVGLSLSRDWAPGWRSKLSLDHQAPHRAPRETWLRLETDLRLGPAQLALRGGLEQGGQYSAELSGSGRLFGPVQFNLRAAAKKLRFEGGGESRIQDMAVGLAYTAGLFDLRGDTSFHRDLINGQRQVDPRLQLRLTPLRLYGGLLQLRLLSVLQYSRLSRPGFLQEQYKANLATALESQPLPLARRTDLSFALQAEQFFDNTPAGDVTSMGSVVRLRQALLGIMDFDLSYRYHTRRQSRRWFLTGSASQEWTAKLGLAEKVRRLSGWASLSGDPVTGQLTIAYTDLTLRLIGSWYLQVQYNYDFLLGNRSANVFLSRRAGRVIVRASYRSLSRQFIVEVLPGG